MEPLYDKILVFLIQLHPLLQIAEGLDLIKNLQYQLDPSFRYVIEVRQSSWFNELFYNYIKEKKYCLVWSEQDILITPPVVTTDFVYLRLIGDRNINERDFGTIQKNRMKEMQLWTNIFKDIQKNEKNVKNAIIAANNHYAGFGPMTANLLAEMMKLKNHVRSFPLVDYKIPISSDINIYENNDNYQMYKKQHYSKKTRQTDISEFFK